MPEGIIGGVHEQAVIKQARQNYRCRKRLEMQQMRIIELQIPRVQTQLVLTARIARGDQNVLEPLQPAADDE